MRFSSSSESLSFYPKSPSFHQLSDALKEYELAQIEAEAGPHHAKQLVIRDQNREDFALRVSEEKLRRTRGVDREILFHIVMKDVKSLANRSEIFRNMYTGGEMGVGKRL